MNTLNFRRRPELEKLEDRTLLAGNCTAVLNRAGDLVVRCDRQDNFVTIEGYGDSLEVQGHFGTTINGQDTVELPDLRRDLKVSTGRGDDTVYLYNLDVPRHLTFKGGAGKDFLGGQETAQVEGRQLVSAESQGRQANDVMQHKLNQAIQQLSRPGLAEDVYRQAIDEGMEAIYTSNLVVLPTPATNEIPGDTGENPEFEGHRMMVNQLVEALTRHIRGVDLNNRTVKGLGTPGSQKGAAEARNFLQITTEAMQVIGGQTAFCDPRNPQNGAGCGFLQADDEGGTVVDSVLGNLFNRQVRSPFPLILPSVTAGLDEQVILTDPLQDGECAAVVKEIQGIKVVVSPRKIAVWAEPWFARARVVGFKTVWAWEFVPAEFIKTISVCNNNGALTTNAATQVVVERELLHFWKFMNKEITAVA